MLSGFFDSGRNSASAGEQTRVVCQDTGRSDRFPALRGAFFAALRAVIARSATGEQSGPGAIKSPPRASDKSIGNRALPVSGSAPVRLVTMGQSQEEIDALLADVSQLAAQTAADIVGPSTAASTAPGDKPSSFVPDYSQSAPKRVQTPSSQNTVSRTSAGRAEDPKRILMLEVPVIVTLAERTMPLTKILTLSPGSIIEFDKPSDGLLDLMINNRCVGRGQAVKVGENFGLRVTVVGSTKSRMDAMAGT